MPKRSFSGDSVDGPLREAMVDAFNAALDENEDLSVSLAIAFETGNAIMRNRSSDLTLAEKIVSAVASHHGLDMMSLYAAARVTSICRPRFVAWWLIRKHTGMSYPAIGMMFRGFNHSTVIAGCQRVEASDALLAEAQIIEKALSLPARMVDLPPAGDGS